MEKSENVLNVSNLSPNAYDVIRNKLYLEVEWPKGRLFRQLNKRTLFFLSSLGYINLYPIFIMLG